MNKINGFLLLIAALIVPSIAFADLAQHKRTCSSIGFTAGTEAFGDCVIRLVKMGQKKSSLAIAQAENQKQQRELASQRAQAAEDDKNRKLDAVINFLAPIANGDYSNSRGSRPSLGGLRTCRYQVGGQIATHTISATSVCPVSMPFGGVIGTLRP